MTVTVKRPNKTDVTFEGVYGEYYIDWEVNVHGDLSVYKRYPTAEFNGCFPKPYRSFAKGTWQEISREC